MRERRPRPASSRSARRPARTASCSGERSGRAGAGKPFRASERSGRPGAGKPFRAGERAAVRARAEPFRAGERSRRPGAGKSFRASDNRAGATVGRVPSLRDGGVPRARFSGRGLAVSRALRAARSARSRHQVRAKSKEREWQEQIGRRPRPDRQAGTARDIGKVLDRQPWDLLTPHLLRAGADIVEVMPRIRRFAELLLEWNRGFSNLISTSDENRLVQRHILESLEPAHWIKSSGARRWLDFGSGGGLPALPLALAGIGASWTLVESRRNKTLFIRKVIQELELKNIEVELARLESLSADAERLGKFDGFTSRATLRLGPTLALAADWVQAGRPRVPLEGQPREQEMVEDRRWEAFWDLDGVFAIGDGQTVVARFIRKTT